MAPVKFKVGKPMAFDSRGNKFDTLIGGYGVKPEGEEIHPGALRTTEAAAWAAFWATLSEYLVEHKARVVEVRKPPLYEVIEPLPPDTPAWAREFAPKPGTVGKGYVRMRLSVVESAA